jgi:amino acid transporter/mannitol/fructose-specific phosphotransferase system IIA component (Ntr-type)
MADRAQDKKNKDETHVPNTLKRELGLLGVFAVSSGAMISSGLFILPGIAFAKSGPAVVVSYLVAGLLILPSMFASAELSTAMPRAGGAYFYTERSLGPVLGTFAGFANWFSLSLKSAFALVGIGAFAAVVFPSISTFEVKIFSVGACLFFSGLNLASVKGSGRSQIVMVIGLLVILAGYVAVGFVSTEPAHYRPFMPKGMEPVLATAGLVFVSFGGLTKVASVAEEVKDPKRNLPLGMFLSFGVVLFLYVMAVAITVGLVPAGELAHSLTPLSQGAAKASGRIGAVLLSLAAILAFVTTANSGIMSASRSPLAMSRDELLPKFFARVNKRFGTPHVGIAVTAGFMITVILVLDIEQLVKTASTLMIILFILTNVAVVVMRASGLQTYRPKFRMPGAPWVPLLSVVAYSVLLFEMGWVPLAITGGFFALGGITYWTYSRIRVKRSSAIMHIVERITARTLASKTLEKELRDIVIERDDIIEDRFDRLIRDAPVLDADDAEKLEDVLDDIAGQLAERLDADPEQLKEAILEREKESCTVIRRGLAIPHVVIPGEKKFDIMLVRSRPGMTFPCASDPVHTIFVLAGTKDERNFHLKALMAIAQIAQQEDFEERWLKASDPESLRNEVLLSSRQRDGG